MQHIPPTNLLLAAKQEPYKKTYLLTKNLKNFLEKVRRTGQQAEKIQQKKRDRTGQKNKRVSQLVSWCSEPSQPQRITSGLNKNFTLSPS